MQLASGDGGGALARKADGSVWSCSSYTQLIGRPGTNNAAGRRRRSRRCPGIVDVAMGSSVAVALDEERRRSGPWGKNINHDARTCSAWPSAAEQRPRCKVPLPAGPPVVDVEIDYSATTFATRADGTVLVWGDNNYGSGGHR